MVRTGAKGSQVNLAQLSHGGVIGQQLRPNGQRFIEASFHAVGALESTGFIQSSYMDGMTPVEGFMNARNGLTSLADTAVKTRDTGYAQRKLMFLMEDVIVKQQQLVRTSTGTIVAWQFGGDGWDTDFLTLQPLAPLAPTHPEHELWQAWGQPKHVLTPINMQKYATYLLQGSTDPTEKWVTVDWQAAPWCQFIDRQSTRLNSSHVALSRMPSSA